MKENEYKTIFSDIDGTLIRQVPFEEMDANNVEVLPGVAEKMAEWYKAGHYVVLTTARPEKYRGLTIMQMNNAGILFNQLVMGIGRSERILINNNSKYTPDVNRAFAVPVHRDGGFSEVDFSSVGL